jgi:IS30 family transposase
MKKKYCHLSDEERFVIEKLYRASVAIRTIARFLDRSPNTISREIEKNQVDGIYTAGKASHKASARRWRAKRQCLKVAMSGFLASFVEEKLREKWSPRQISGYLKRELDITCSAKAIYKFTESRGLEYLLFWSWNKKKGGHKRSHWKNPRDGRKYVNERPEVYDPGHVELDFVVCKQSTWVLLVAVDICTKKSWVWKLPNRKRSTIRTAFSWLSEALSIKTITTDNDIAFTNWKELELLLGTQIYFTHPYHSWEKGLVENTNRWIRCFVPKRRDISTVTEKEMNDIHSFLNDRPRECIGFRMPGVYYMEVTSVLLRG